MARYDQRGQNVGRDQVNIAGDLHIHVSTSKTQQQQGRRRMLKRVGSRWVSGFLDVSLHGAELLALSLYEQPDAVLNPWHAEIQEMGVPARPLPSNTRIMQAYENASHQLLILGAPGAGKTTLLLELARDLIEQASLDDSKPIPAVFNLVSWAVKRQPLAEWLVEELREKYQVSSRIGGTWVEDDQLLLLLDGLDEMSPSDRSACIKAINDYKREHDEVPTVVCCRHDDYFMQAERLLLQNAVIIQPLTLLQIDIYLSSLGDATIPIRNAVRKNRILQEMVAVPLMLNVLALTYVGHSADDLLIVQSPEAWRERLFSTYIQRMLRRRRADIRYTSKQTIQWLSWLAQQLTRHSQTEFYIERMQPDWFSGALIVQLAYEGIVRLCISILCVLIYEVVITLISRLLPLSVSFLFVGPVFGILVGLLLKVEEQIKPAEIIVWSWKGLWNGMLQVRNLGKALLIWLCVSVLAFFIDKLFFGGTISLPIHIILALFCSIFFGLTQESSNELPQEAVIDEFSPLTRSTDKLHSVQDRYVIGSSFGLASGLIFSLLAGFIITLILLSGNAILPASIHIGLYIGLLYGATFGLIAGTLIGLTTRTQTTTPFMTMTGLLLQHIYLHLVNDESLRSGLIFALLFWLVGVITKTQQTLLYILTIWMLGSLLFSLFRCLIAGLSTSMQDEQSLMKPNQGIRNSIRNSMLVGGIAALLGWLTFGLFFALIVGFVVMAALTYGVSVDKTLNNISNIFLSSVQLGALGGLLCGLLVALDNGGVAFIQHFILRLFLSLTRTQPWKYTRFLDYATERILLRRIGGGYMFVHRLLLEHLSNSPRTSIPQDTFPKEVQRIKPVKSSTSIFIRIGLSISILAFLCLSPGSFAASTQTNSSASGTQALSTQTIASTYPPSGWQLAVNGLRAKSSPWIDYYETGPLICGFVGDHYQINSDPPIQNRFCDADNFMLTNLAFEAQMRIDTGDQGGIIFRFKDAGNFYRFSISQTGSYLLEHAFANQATILARGESSNIHTGLHQLNTLAIVAQDNIFNLYINQQFIRTVTENVNSVDLGRIGLTAISPISSTQVSFLHTKIWISEQNTSATLLTRMQTYPPAQWHQVLDDPMHYSTYLENIPGNLYPQANCAFIPNANPPLYQVTVVATNTFYHCSLQNTTFTNFAIEASVRITAGDLAGVVFRDDRNTGTDYFFAISTSGSYYFYLFVKNKQIKVLSGDARAAIKQGLGQTNILAVVAQQQNLGFYINRIAITTISDTTISQGQVGLGVLYQNNSTQAQFDTLKVWQER